MNRRSDRFASAQAAWRQLLQDAGVEYFEFGDVGSNVPAKFVGAGARIFDEGGARETVEFGTVIARRSNNDNGEGRYVALQFHPPHPELQGPQQKLWHFHARKAIVVEVPRNQRDTFQITDGFFRGFVESDPNSHVSTCLEHYFIDPAARRTNGDGDNAEFAIQMRKFANGIGPNKLSGDLAFNYKKIHESMLVLVAQYENTFGRG